MSKPYRTKPIGLPPKVVAPIIGVSLPSIYRRIRDRSLPTLDLDGQFLVSVPKLESQIGRSLTLDEINAALSVADTITGNEADTGQSRAPASSAESATNGKAK